MFANPYALLAAGLALVAALIGADHFGYKRAENAAAARIAAAQVEIIDRANRDIEASTARAVAQAKAEAAARLSATTIRLKGERDAAIKARPECARDADSLGLLQQSIDHANDSTTTRSSLPPAL
jgi:hypothetical protein